MATTATMQLLERAAAAMRTRPHADALELLLRAWVEVRAPELGELIDALTQALLDARPPRDETRAEQGTGTKRERTREQSEAAWHARMHEADALELAALLPSLVDANSHVARRRLALIARFAPDPRIATCLTDIVLDPPFTASSTAKFWQRLHPLLRTCADPRALARLERAPAVADDESSLMRLDKWRAKTVALMREQLSSMRCELEPNELACVQAMRKQLDAATAASADAGAELLDMIQREPGVLEHRSVYADLLLSRGDPRGEFILLSIAAARGQLDRAGKRRHDQLLAAHLDTWLGPLARVLVRSDIEFARGFLSRARIKAGVRGLDALLDDPLWSTVETLENAPPQLLASPRLVSLRSLRCSARQLYWIVDGELRMPNIHTLAVVSDTWQISWLANTYDAMLRTNLERPDCLPGVRQLTLYMNAITQPDALAWTWSGPLAERLRTLTITLSGDRPLGLLRYVWLLRGVQAHTLAWIEIGDRSCVARFTAEAGVWSRVELTIPRRAPVEQARAELRGLEQLSPIEIVLDARARKLLRDDSSAGA